MVRSFQDVNGESKSRKPQYDEGTVLKAATRLFSRHAYANSSISDLTESTGISRT
ncbi:TetR family transcriptional regulator, partial [Pseudomonas syringae pv. tagetis]